MTEKKHNVLHGLPHDVIYCKKCVMSNQRPSSHPEFTKKTTSDTPVSAFGEDGVCDACRYTEFKKTIEWDGRLEQLKELCDKHRRNDGTYDVLVPGSGGKDSIFVSHYLKYEMDMNPLTVTWAPHAYTEVGLKNLYAWMNTGVDNILFTPNPLVHRKLTKLAFVNLLNPFQPFILGQKMLAPRMAMKYGIELIMYGENQAEAHNKIAETESPIMDSSHYAVNDKNKPIYLGGVEINDLHAEGINIKDLEAYLPLDINEVDDKGLEIHFMSYYWPWSPQQNYYYAKEHSEFESNPDGRSEGTYSKYSSLDDKIDGQHYFTSLIKFGQGRAMNDACRDIRDGYISREEGVHLVKKYDEEFPEKYYEFFLKYINLGEEEYWELINKARSEHLWIKEGDKWKLRHPCK